MDRKKSKCFLSSMVQLVILWYELAFLPIISFPLVLIENLLRYILTPELMCVWGILCPVLACVLFIVWDLLFISSISVGRTGRPWDLSVAVEKGSNSLDWLAHEIIVMWGIWFFSDPEKGLRYYICLRLSWIHVCKLSLPAWLSGAFAYLGPYMQCLVFSALEFTTVCL